ncbi:MAG TPA: matrixin family metalloprotease [Nocardioidaceae bacterium]|nr:matrixin family metalloprotease [Nocardioidaceae bacterium]
MTDDQPEEGPPIEQEPEPSLEHGPVLTPAERSPYAPSLATKLLAVATSVVIFGGGLLYSLRYELGLVEGHYQFMVVDRGGDPVTYPACRPISYAVFGDTSLRGGQELIDEAVAQIVADTGLSFVPLGHSAPDAMVRITWSDPETEPRLAGETVGLGGSTSVVDEETGRRYYVRGVVNLDTPDLAESYLRHGRDEVRAVIMHELAHVVGLDHVDDPNELMHAENLGKTEFGPGDREGLAELGKGPCLGQDS